VGHAGGSLICQAPAADDTITCTRVTATPIAGEGTEMARTQRERHAEARAKKLADIDEQVRAGRLSIRQMTREERERYRPRPRTGAARRPGPSART
jgi:anti-sigma factor RsiW